MLINLIWPFFDQFSGNVSVYAAPEVEDDLSLETGLTAYLKSTARLTALIGDRVFPYYVPREVERALYPCVTYEINEVPTEAIGGQSGAALASVDLNCWAPSFADSCRVAEAARRAMQGYSGYFGDTPIVSCFYQSLDDECQEPKDNSSVYWFCRTVTFSIVYVVPLHTF